MNAYSEEYRISESMFSGVYKLNLFPEELLLRIHPNKRATYDAIINSKAIVTNEGREVTINDVVLYVNTSEGIVEIPYSTIKNTKIGHIIYSTSVPGFDAEGDPYIYKLRDGTVRIVFSSMPPQNPVNRESFDMDSFSNDFISSMDVEIIHDDREVFHIPSPIENTIEDIISFLKTYKVKN